MNKFKRLNKIRYTVLLLYIYFVPVAMVLKSYVL
jgi:hypothetical protein